jgi:hypothetical protein
MFFVWSSHSGSCPHRAPSNQRCDFDSTPGLRPLPPGANALHLGCFFILTSTYRDKWKAAKATSAGAIILGAFFINAQRLGFDYLSALAMCQRSWHYESMAVQINIRDIPEKVRDELASRAAMQGKSMQEFLRAELERLAARPSLDAWLQQVRKRKRAAQTRISSDQILDNRNADRR